MMQQAFEHLIGGHHVVQAHQGDGVLHPGIVGVKGNEIGNAHMPHFLEHDRTVQGLPVVSPVLPAAIQQRHDHVDSVRLSLSCLNQALQVLIMVIRRHMVFIAKQLIRAVIIAHIRQNKQVRTPNSGLDEPLSVSGGKPGTFCFNQEGLFISAALSAPLNQILVNFLPKLFRTVHYNESQGRYPVSPVKNCIG